MIIVGVVRVSQGKRFTQYLEELTHETFVHLIQNMFVFWKQKLMNIISFVELVEPEEHKLLGADGSSTDVRYVGKPYSSLEVSSNMSDINKLTDGNTGSYWQSDGAARSHWIR